MCQTDLVSNPRHSTLWSMVGCSGEKILRAHTLKISVKAKNDSSMVQQVVQGLEPRHQAWLTSINE